MELSPTLYHRIVRPKWLTRHYIGNIIEKSIEVSGKNVLDFGCGTGANCCLFNPASYLGIDPDEDRIRYAQKTYPDYQFHIMKDHHINVPSHSMDYVLIVSVLHHIHPDKLPCYLQEFRRILKSGGAVLVIEPCFLRHTLVSNYLMKLIDRGRFIQMSDNYIQIFQNSQYDICQMKEYKQLILYNKIFFTARPV